MANRSKSARIHTENHHQAEAKLPSWDAQGLGATLMSLGSRISMWPVDTCQTIAWRHNGQVLQLLSFHRFTDLGTLQRTDSEDIFSNCCEPVGLPRIMYWSPNLNVGESTNNCEYPMTLLNCYIQHQWIWMEYTNLIESLHIKDNNHSKIQVMSWFHQFCSRHTTNNSHIKPILQLHWLCWADPSCGASLFKWIGNPGYETFTKNHASKIFQGSRTAASPQRLFGHVSIFRQIEKSEQNTTSYARIDLSHLCPQCTQVLPCYVNSPVSSGRQWTHLRILSGLSATDMAVATESQNTLVGWSSISSTVLSFKEFGSNWRAGHGVNHNKTMVKKLQWFIYMGWPAHTGWPMFMRLWCLKHPKTASMCFAETAWNGTWALHMCSPLSSE